MNYDEKCQLLILGESAVGKSSLLRRFFDKEFNDEYNETIGIDFIEQDVLTADSSIIRVKIWDTVGQDRYKSLIQCYIKQVDGIILVYDINDVRSFYSLKNWLKTLNSMVMQTNIKFLLLGNKLDLERNIPKEVVAEYAKANSLTYNEVSAKTGEGVSEGITGFIQEIANDKETYLDTNPNCFDPKRRFKRLTSLISNKRKEKKSRCICY